MLQKDTVSQELSVKQQNSRVETKQEIPLEKGYPLIGVLPQFLSDPYRFCKQLEARHDGIVCFMAGGSKIYLLSHPDYLHRILRDNPGNYCRGRTFEAIRAVIGDGIFTNDGDIWRRHRRLMQPAFHRSHINQLINTMTDVIDKHITGWQVSVKESKALNMFDEMMAINMQVLMKSLFGTSLTEENTEKLVEQTKFVFNSMNKRVWTGFLPIRIPLPGDRKMQEAINNFEKIVIHLLEERQSQPDSEKNTDLVNMLMSAVDEETNSGLTLKEIRDEILTVILAGYESTASNLAWTLWLLSKHKDVAHLLTEEVDQVLDGRFPTMEDIPKLKYTRMIVDETLRLYPSFPIGFRTAIGPDQFGEYEVPAGAEIIYCIYAPQHNAEYWNNPHNFDPARFSEERFTSEQKRVYFAFGEGQRMCIGRDLALTEAQLILAMVAQRYDRELVPGSIIEEKYSLTLYPRHGVPMYLQPRN